jgi:CRISPR-associated protein Csy3
MAKNTSTLPSNLSFSRSVEPTAGVMSAVKFGAAAPSLKSVLAADPRVIVTPVTVSATTVRGTIANDHKDAPAKRVGTGEKALNSANIATIEQALLPVDAGHLLVSTAIRFSGHALSPNACNSPLFRASLTQFVTAYAKQLGFIELARRYLLNILNGSWLWRNRFGQNVEVSVQLNDEVLLVSEADIDMTRGFTSDALVRSEHRPLFELLVAKIAAAFAGEAQVMLTVSGLVELGAGAEVYPSQEFSSGATEKVVKGREADKVDKVLSKQMNSEGQWVATMHARKIGNAIRTIDTWHGQPDVGPLAVEIYGANTHQGEAHRISGNDLYTYLKHPEQLAGDVAIGVTDVHHYVVACLIRGGVFGFAEAAKNKKGEAAADTEE